MNHDSHMTITFPDGSRCRVPKGLSLLEIMAESGHKFPQPVVAAKINNRLTNLRHKLRVDSRVEFIDCTHPEGFRVYQSSLCYLLGMAVFRVFPGVRMHVEHSLSKGLYCALEKDTPLTEDELRRIQLEMEAIVCADMNIHKEKTYLDEARQFFVKTGQDDKIRLFRYSNPHTVNMYHCDGYQNYSDCPLVSTTGLLNLFQLVFHPPGFVMLMPEPYSAAAAENGPEVPDFVPQPKLFYVFQEYQDWLEILELEDIGAFNELVVQDKFHEIIRISEALQEKKIARIADAVSQRRIVLIGGPSSSGKTTFSMRLADQLRANGLNPVPIALDDYFLDRDKTPRDINGEYDFESLRALDVPLLTEHFAAMVEGRSVELPRYDFISGKRILRHRRVEITPHTIILFEGIHAINPELLKNLAAELISRVYVSPLTTLNLDNHNRIPTTDVRLLRRMVRDYLFRGYDALETLQRWQAVRRGETAYIFPYQNDADHFFNSALVYELAILKRFAEPILLRISTEHPEYSEARRLLNFLSYFQDIPPEHVPSNSILREFIGKSVFRY
ncbi:MAG: nucleoside kinase [Acidobacteria bacterium]|nr:nucleoside kinase [Acidobacteriota bacterium]